MIGENLELIEEVTANSDNIGELLYFRDGSDCGTKGLTEKNRREQTSGSRPATTGPMRPDAFQTRAHLQVQDGLGGAQNSASALLPDAIDHAPAQRAHLCHRHLLFDAWINSQTLQNRSASLQIQRSKCRASGFVQSSSIQLKADRLYSHLRRSGQLGLLEDPLTVARTTSRRSPSRCSSSSAFKISCDSAIFRSSDLPPSRPRREPRRGRSVAN